MARGRKNREYEQQEAPQYEESQEATRLVNSGSRADIIRDAVRYIAEREAEIKEIREDINTYKQTHIKGDLGFKLADFAAVMRIYKLGVEDRDQLLDTIREGFAALGIGGSVDWVEAAEKADNVTPIRSKSDPFAENGDAA